jgi:hypothetical protein
MAVYLLQQKTLSSREAAKLPTRSKSTTLPSQARGF